MHWNGRQRAAYSLRIIKKCSQFTSLLNATCHPQSGQQQQNQQSFPQSGQQQQNQQSCIVTPRHAVKWKRAVYSWMIKNAVNWHPSWMLCIILNQRSSSKINTSMASLMNSMHDPPLDGCLFHHSSWTTSCKIDLYRCIYFIFTMLFFSKLFLFSLGRPQQLGCIVMQFQLG